MNISREVSKPLKWWKNKHLAFCKSLWISLLFIKMKRFLLTWQNIIQTLKTLNRINKLQKHRQCGFIFNNLRAAFITNFQLEPRESHVMIALMMSRIQATLDSMRSYMRGRSVPLCVQAMRHEETPTRAHRFSSDSRHIIGLPANSSSCVNENN